jgi:SAM-dependent methyltransferase
MNACSPEESPASCPVCAGTDLVLLAAIPSVPLFCNALVHSASAARDVRRGAIDLAGCRGCGHIFNRAFDPALMAYGTAYENSLHFSSHYQGYAERTARRLIDRYALRGKTIVEVGCGHGDFLRLLCEPGGNTGIGYDPSQTGQVIPLSGPLPGDGRLIVHGRLFGVADAEGADLIVSRHVLEHLSHPLELLKLLRRAGVPLFLEIPNGLFTLERQGIWDLIYEHVSYFTPTSLTAALMTAGFGIRELASDFGEQFLWVEAEAADTPGLPPRPDDRLLDSFDSFRRHYAEIVHRWSARVAEERRSGHRLMAWGAGSKGVTFLNVLGLTAGSGLDHVVDINPRKSGAFIPGTGQPIVPPSALTELRPDTILIMNPEYRHEIAATLRGLGLAPELIAVAEGG